MKAALVIFAKNPVLIKTKTGSARIIGNKEAVAIQHQLLLHTYNITVNYRADKFVFYKDFIDEDDLWSNGKYQKYLQLGNNFSERLMYAFDTVFEQGYKKALMISGDSIETEAVHIHEAFDCLKHSDVVIGPAQSGGWYLLGMKKMHQQLLLDKKWNTELMLQQTLDDLAALRLSYHFLPVLNDVTVQEELHLQHHRQ